MSPDSLCRWQVQVYIYIEFGGYMRILGAPSVQSCYLLPKVYLFMADSANIELFVCSCRTWICLDITRFYEEQRQPSSGSAWPACQHNGKSGTQLAQQFVTTVTAPPNVGCVVWSHHHHHDTLQLIYYILVTVSFAQTTMVSLEIIICI